MACLFCLPLIFKDLFRPPLIILLYTIANRLKGSPRHASDPTRTVDRLIAEEEVETPKELAERFSSFGILAYFCLSGITRLSSGILAGICKPDDDEEDSARSPVFSSFDGVAKIIQSALRSVVINGRGSTVKGFSQRRIGISTKAANSRHRRVGRSKGRIGPFPVVISMRRSLSPDENQLRVRLPKSMNMTVHHGQASFQLMVRCLRPRSCQL